MRHRHRGRQLTRTSAHRIAMRRNLAQSLFQYGEIETTLPKAKEMRQFVERLITIARNGGLLARQRVISMLGDRAVIPTDQQEKYEEMSRTRRHRVLRARSGRRHRGGAVPASYNKKKIPFVATSIVQTLMGDVAPRFKDRSGGYTRIIPIARRRIGDNSALALLQLVGTEEATSGNVRKSSGRRSRRVEARKRRLREGSGKKSREGKAKSAPPSKPPETPE